MSSSDSDLGFVSRGGTKLAWALEQFGVDPRGWLCADLGSHVGGFVDCLLQREAARVYAVDTSYGTLAWRLRKDPRVVVMERCNAMHVTLPEAVDLVTIDVGWTRQARIVGQARRLVRPTGQIITLIKPHYEADPQQLRDGVLEDRFFNVVVEQVLQDIAAAQLVIVDRTDSPLTGHGGNREILALLRPVVQHHGDAC